MKNLLSILLFGVAILTVACNKKVKEAVSENPPIIEETIKEEMQTEEEAEEVVKKEVYALLKLKKTACYGRCPVYEVTINTDGSAIYEGKRFVEKEGIFNGQVDEKTIAAIRAKANEVGYFDFYNKYPTDEKQRIVDLPMTITSVRFGDMIKEVRNNNGAPEKLEKFEDWVEELIGKIEWTQ